MSVNIKYQKKKKNDKVLRFSDVRLLFDYIPYKKYKSLLG